MGSFRFFAPVVLCLCACSADVGDEAPPELSPEGDPSTEYSAIVTPSALPRLIVRRQNDDGCSFMHFIGMTSREPDGALPAGWDFDDACLSTSCDATGAWEECSPADGVDGWLRIADGDWFPTTMSMDMVVFASSEMHFATEDLLVVDATGFE